jgi:monofunctional biosynthetic peptidoglycan transglycosylase
MRVLRLAAAAGAVAFAVLAYVYVTLPDVRPLARTNPTTTAFMELRAREATEAGRKLRKVHRWVPYSRISRNLTRAVIVAEDAAFWDHEGLDFEEIKKSIEIAFEQGGEIRGASTITQQLAKNLYLSPSRDPLRKLREVIIARRLEATLPKARIFEIYLNVVEWGDGIWGAEAAARTYFGVSAAGLSPEQAALLAGALINPIVYSPARPPARLIRRQRIILSRMGVVRAPAPAPVAQPPSEAPPVESEEEAPAEDVLPETDPLSAPGSAPVPPAPEPPTPEPDASPDAPL